MHEPRIPFDFDFHCQAARCHIASGETGTFWFGLLVFLGVAWNLSRGFRDGGDFGVYRWKFLPADRDHPFMYWAMATINFALLLLGADFIVSGLIGTKPLSFL